MKAIVCSRYGPPEALRLADVAKPVPADDEVLIKIHAVSVNRSDWEGLIGEPLYARLGGLFRPGRPILGSDIAGRVESVGKAHTQFRPGDAVFGDILGRLGGFAEYVCARGNALALKPAGLTFAQAAALPQAAVIALQGIRDKGQIQPGQRVLINGAGGGAGAFALQLAKRAEAEVTGVDNVGKLDFMRGLGADHVIDYAREDYTAGGERYDFILDPVAYRSAFAYARALRPGGSFYVVGGSAAILLQAAILGPLIRRATGKRIAVLMVRPNRADLIAAAELVQTGRLNPMIDRRYPLSQVPDALRYLGDGRARGKLIIDVDDADTL
jgi:NADPH:quinone reductase-like Zn-dependent oxidoreductase